MYCVCVCVCLCCTPVIKFEWYEYKKVNPQQAINKYLNLIFFPQFSFGSNVAKFYPEFLFWWVVRNHIYMCASTDEYVIQKKFIYSLSKIYIWFSKSLRCNKKSYSNHLHQMKWYSGEKNGIGYIVYICLIVVSCANGFFSFDIDMLSKLCRQTIWTIFTGT